MKHFKLTLFSLILSAPLESKELLKDTKIIKIVGYNEPTCTIENLAPQQTFGERTNFKVLNNSSGKTTLKVTKTNGDGKDLLKANQFKVRIRGDIKSDVVQLKYYKADLTFKAILNKPDKLPSGDLMAEATLVLDCDGD